MIIGIIELSCARTCLFLPPSCLYILNNIQCSGSFTRKIKELEALILPSVLEVNEF